MTITLPGRQMVLRSPLGQIEMGMKFLVTQKLPQKVLEVEARDRREKRKDERRGIVKNNNNYPQKVVKNLYI